MYKKNIKEDALTSWMKFYSLINNKETLDYADTVKAIVLINFTMEEFIIKREELEELVDRSVISSEIMDRKESYIDNNIIYMPAGLNIHFHEKKGSEYNQYIYNVSYSILMENIDIFFNATERLINAVAIENIKKARELNSKYSQIVDRIMKLLYLFDLNDTVDRTINKIYKYIAFSIKTEGIMLKSVIKEVLELLLEKSVIDIDYEGNYFIISEERKAIRRKMVAMLRETEENEINKLLKDIIKDSFKELTNTMGDELEISLSILGEKINKGINNLNVKLDLHVGSERDSRKSYYLLNTRQFENIVYWYSNKSIEFYNKINWLLAYSKAIEFYIDRWSGDKEKMKFLKQEHENRMHVLKEIKDEVLQGFENGSLIYNGEEKIIENQGDCKNIIVSIAEDLVSRNRYKKILM